MELRQLRYFVRIVELGSMGRAALDLDMVQSALSQQISRLESELSTRKCLRHRVRYLVDHGKSSGKCQKIATNLFV